MGALRPAIFSTAAVTICLVVCLGYGGAGPQTRHMVLHIVLMSILAPLTAIALRSVRMTNNAARHLWAAAVLQILVLWLLHTPAIGHGISGAAQLTIGFLLLVATAVWFWRLILFSAQRWHAVATLLLTGKLTCLIAILFVFAPRLLYDTHLHHPAASLDDQHLAGLVMVTACPLSYLVAAAVIAGDVIFSDRSRVRVTDQ